MIIAKSFLKIVLVFITGKKGIKLGAMIMQFYIIINIIRLYIIE